ncbi:MAG: penicillin-binding transpeptidase domain-containing protein [Chryseolinea sp.]
MNEGRREIIQIAFVFVAVIFLVKLFFIQVLDDRYEKLAYSNAIRREVDYPVRGLIKDRNGKLIVYNTPEFDLQIILKEVKTLDTVKFCEVFGLTHEGLLQKFKELKMKREYSSVKPTTFLTQLSTLDFAKIQDNIDLFQGFYIQARTTRAYRAKAAANAIGYVSEISKYKLEHDATGIYKQGDYIGQSGIESFYEPYLRGQRGVRFKLRNVDGVEKGSFSDGKIDTLSVPGEDIITSIDLDLQSYGEKLLNGKSGSVIAIEPSTGEILAMVSGPTYDPALLTGKNYSSNYVLISNDSLKPLFNRPLMAQYRPGSIFKVAQAMVALQEGVITPETRFKCDRGHPMNCHGAHTNEDLRGAITNSCNPYFYNVLKRMVNKGATNDPFSDARVGLEEWSKHMRSFGLGKPLGIDLPNEKGGLVPSVAYYDRAYRGRPWKFSNIYSIAIGEGENLVVPLQMANFAATIANKGFYITPHLVKGIGNTGMPLPQYLEKHYTTIDSANFRIAADAMERVIQEGTGSYRGKVKDIVICGKTGSVQNPPLADHSVFIAFAPKVNPKIAVSVYVEYAGGGARAAASIASLMIEKYLKGGTSRPQIEEYVLKGNFE